MKPLARFSPEKTREKTLRQLAHQVLANTFLGAAKWSVMTLPGMNIEKCAELYHGYKGMFMAERDIEVYKFLESKCKDARPRAELLHLGDFFHLTHLIRRKKIGRAPRISMVDYDYMGNFDAYSLKGLTEIIHSGILAKRSVIRMTFTPRRQGMNVINRQLGRLKARIPAGVRIQDDPILPYREHGNYLGQPMVSMQLKLER